MSRAAVPRLLATSSLLGATTALRVGTRSAGLLYRHAPALARLAATASVGGQGAGRAQAVFRDELIGLYREAAELSWRELRRAMDDFDRMTRPGDPPLQPQAAAPRLRPYRVKP